MSFLSKLESIFNLDYALKFFGTVALFAALLFSPAKTKVIGFAGVAMFAAGAAYKKLYKS